jgi:hypothetical protein
LGILGPDLAAVWTAATTTPRDRKQPLGKVARKKSLRTDASQRQANPGMAQRTRARNHSVGKQSVTSWSSVRERDRLLPRPGHVP